MNTPSNELRRTQKAEMKTIESAYAEKTILNQKLDAARSAMLSFPGLRSCLNPYPIEDPENPGFLALRDAYNAAWAEMRAFNTAFDKRFAKEIARAQAKREAIFIALAG